MVIRPFKLNKHKKFSGQSKVDSFIAHFIMLGLFCGREGVSQTAGELSLKL